MNKRYLNFLRQGERLSGFLTWQHGQETFSVPGVLCLEEARQVVIRLILRSDSPVKLAFDSSLYMEANGEEAEAISVPEVCAFESTGGALTLVQAQEYQGHTEVLGNPIEIAFRPRFAISMFVEPPQWKNPVGMRAEIGGLEEWISSGISGRFINLVRDSETYVSKDKITLESFDYKTQAFPFVEDDLCVSIKPYAKPSHKEEVNEIGIQFCSVLEVRSIQNGMSWKVGLKELRNFQELLMLLSWTSLEATNLEGKFRQENSQDESFWESINFPCPPKASPVSDWTGIFNSSFAATDKKLSKPKRGFIIPYSEVDQSMMDAWRSMRENKYHPIQLFIQTIENPQMAPEVKALQLGAGIESLGFKLKEETSSTSTADHKKAFQLFRLVGETAKKLLPNLFEKWADEANFIYQAMKHLNRVLPETGKIARINSLSELVVQACLANELGASEETIKSFLKERVAQLPTVTRIKDPSEINVSEAE